MRSRLSVLFFALLPALALAQRIEIKPWNFAPLTSLPWQEEKATNESVVRALYLEPDLAIRRTLLVEYLMKMPVDQIEDVFDLCLALEGQQQPDDLVGLVLKVWGERAPKAAWARTKKLMPLVGLKDGWLNLDSWARPKITVQDRKAISESKFWLRGTTLSVLPEAIDRSKLQKAERLPLLREFANEWFDRFGDWPGSTSHRSGESYEKEKATMEAFNRAGDELEGWLRKPHSGFEETAFEICLRRWLVAQPAKAPEAMELAMEATWPPFRPELEPRKPGTSPALLLLWAKADSPAMAKWTDSLDAANADLACRARGVIMSQVDEKTRSRWLAEVKKKFSDDETESLLNAWAEWEPKPAFEKAVALRNADVVREVVEHAAYGPWGSLPHNTTHFGLGFVRDLDIDSLIKKIGRDLINEWGISVMELWGQVDVGEAARYAFDFIVRTNYEPRENLIRLFSGDDKFAHDSDMVDRAFSALRAWAVFKPDEMKPWIGKQKGEDMRRALLWLLEHPWGTGSDD